jgi:hypothetical protein
VVVGAVARWWQGGLSISTNTVLVLY